MKLPHLFRCLMCFLLIFALVGNAFFTPVNATAITALATVGVASTIAVGAILIGAGVLPGSDSAVFTSTVKNIVSSLNLGNTVQMVTWAASGFQKYAVPETLIERVRSACFSSSVITTITESTVRFPGGTTFTDSSNNTITLNGDHYMFAHKYNNLSANIVVVNVSGGLPSVTISDGSSPTINSYRDVYCTVITPGSGEIMRLGLPTYKDSYYDYKSAYYFMNGAYDTSPKEVTTVAEGLSAGVIASEDTDIQTGYETWYIQGVQFYQWSDGSYHQEPEDENNVALPYWPIGIGQTYTETITQTQEQVQSGNSTHIDTSESTSSGFLGNIITWLENIWAAIVDGISTVTTVLQTIPETLAQLMTSVLTDIFVPSSDYVTTKVEALKARFDWIEPILTYAASFKGEFSGATPPVIYVHLQNAEGSYNYGGTVKFLDLTWYSRYKAQGDAILSGFFWALFIWRMYMKLPSIINGVGGDIGSITYGEPKWQQAENREKRRNRS